jgi:hypothetical protein
MIDMLSSKNQLHGRQSSVPGINGKAGRLVPINSGKARIWGGRDRFGPFRVDRQTLYRAGRHAMTVQTDLTADERELLGVFHRHGRDGRAITVLSLFASSPLRADQARFKAALAGLRTKDLIAPCGIDAVTRKPAGYRLAEPVAA